MKTQKRISLNRRLTTITMTVFLCLALLITLSGLLIFQRILRENVRTSTDFNLQMISENIRQQLNSADALSRWCSSSDEVADYLNTPAPSSDSALDLQEDLYNEYYNTLASSNIRRVVLASTLYPSIPLQILHTSADSKADPRSIIETTEGYQKLLSREVSYYITYMKTPFNHDPEDYVLVIMRPVYAGSGTGIVGYVYLELYPAIITSFLEEYTIPDDTAVYLTMEENCYRLGQNSVEKSVQKLKKNTNWVSREIGFRGWTLTQDISPSLLMNQWPVYLYFLLLIILILIIFGILFSIYLNYTLSRPIKKLKSRIDLIATGDFSRDPEIEWNYELGDIGRGINQMSRDMKNLITRKISADHTKTELEYQVLLNQVNPHFMYNTLNSIKWMATIQGASGIADMTTALARLLKSVSKGVSKLITLQDELALLNDYFKILQYRYGGTLTMNCDIRDERLYDAQILKFTLQPLFENAVFHGLEPKQHAGTVSVRGYFLTEDTYHLEVEDNGIGMTEEQIASCISGHHQSSSGLFRGVGIFNVRERIRYEYGTRYDLQIESEKEHFTRVLLTLPYRKKEDSDNVPIINR